MLQLRETFIAIDLKSFYASVECVERSLDPLRTNLVVADEARTAKTICLAVSPSLKRHGIPGRPRLFEVIQKVDAVNALRRREAPGRAFVGKSSDDDVLRASPEIAIDYIVAVPRMALYLAYSSRIYEVYLKYFAPEDIHVYSIDEVMIDVTAYLRTYGMSARELAKHVILEVLETTGITATAGIGTNLYLAKVAMDIMGKKTQPDKDGVRIAELDEMSYREQLWNHRPLTDFWRVGRGYSAKLEAKGLYTMGDIARCSLGQPHEHYNEDLLYRLFGINAELLIDHAWGWEPCTMADIKGYKSSAKSVGTGQVLHAPYTYDKARLVVREMTDLLMLDLISMGLVADQVVLSLGYDVTSLLDPAVRQAYTGPVTVDAYGRQVPKHAHGTANLQAHTSSARIMIDAVMEIFDRIADKNLLVRRVNIAVNRVVEEASLQDVGGFEQLDLFTDYEMRKMEQEAEAKRLQKERSVQNAIIALRQRFGKNAILKAASLEEGATARDRNSQIGGHKA